MDNKRCFKIAKALSDPHRLEVLQKIAMMKETSYSTLADKAPVTQATISRHLKILFDADLIDARKDGQQSFFRINHDVIKKYFENTERKLRVPGAI